MATLRSSPTTNTKRFSGPVCTACTGTTEACTIVRGATITAYGVAATAPLDALPSVPAAKAGGVNYQMSIWAGMFAPKGAPKNVVRTLSVALDKALDDPAVIKRLADLGGSIPKKSERSPAKFEKMVKSEISRWKPILEAAAPPAAAPKSN